MNVYAKAGACLLGGSLLCTQALAERKYSEWGPAVNLGCGTINSASNDQGPGISKDGLSLYFGSDRAGGAGGLDLWVAQRPTQDAPWGTPANLGPVVNSPGTDNVVSFSRDGHRMFFNSNRAGGFGDSDLWASYRAHVHDDFAWKPLSISAAVSTPRGSTGQRATSRTRKAAPRFSSSAAASRWQRWQPRETYGWPSFYPTAPLATRVSFRSSVALKVISVLQFGSTASKSSSFPTGPAQPLMQTIIPPRIYGSLRETASTIPGMPR